MKARFRSVILFMALPLILIGCGPTPYQSINALNSTGGYSNKPAFNGFTKISVAVNSRSKPEAAKIFLVMRAAQVGRDREKKYFSLYKSMADALRDKKSNQPDIDTEVYGSTANAYVKYHDKKQKGDFSVNAIYKKYGYLLNRGASNE